MLKAKDIRKLQKQSYDRYMNDSEIKIIATSAADVICERLRYYVLKYFDTESLTINFSKNKIFDDLNLSDENIDTNYNDMTDEKKEKIVKYIQKIFLDAGYEVSLDIFDKHYLSEITIGWAESGEKTK